MAVAMMGVGYGVKAAGEEAYGNAQNEAGQFRAAQLRQAAGESVASSQRTAGIDLRRSTLLQSRALALAAAGGGGASDPTVARIIASIAGAGQYRANTALYEGRSRAQALQRGADVATYEGEYAKTAGQLSAVGTLLQGSASLYSKYGQGGFPKGNLYDLPVDITDEELLSGGGGQAASPRYGRT